MNTDHSDEAIRSLYRRLEPRVDSEEFWRGLEARLTEKERRPRSRKPMRALLLASACLVAAAVIGTGIYEAFIHLGSSRQIIVITDETTTSTESSATATSLLPNPYPTPTLTSVSGATGESPSEWAEDLGQAILKLYPNSGWEVLRALELEGGLMDVSIGPVPTTGTNTTRPDLARPHIRVQVNREESGRLPQEGNPMQYQEIVTAYGHGLIMPTYNSDGSQSLLTWFVRPDKLFLRVSARQASPDAAQSEPLLDETSVQKLVEYIASIIQMGSVDTSPTTPSTATTTPPAISDEVRGYLDMLESIWKAAGIPVLAVTTAFPDAATEKNVKESTEESDPLPWVVVEIPSSVFASMDYVFIIDNIDRQTMVAVRGGVPLKYLGILLVREDGSKTLWAAGQVSTSNPEWDQPARLALAATTDRLREAALRAATTAGVVLGSFEVKEDASGRVVTAVGSIPDRAEVSASVAGFNGPLEEAVRALNKEGAKISGLNVKVDDLSGAPVLRFALSLNYGNDGAKSSRWLAPELKAVLSE